MQVRAKVRGMKNMAKKLKCPVIVLSQLNRSLVGRPEMKNLLGSSAIEQEADVIMFLYDEDYEGNRGSHSLTEVIFAKNRMGETGATFLQPELSFSRFTNTQRLPAAKPVEEKKYKKREFN
jgi:replicative DNA helicase